MKPIILFAMLMLLLYCTYALIPLNLALAWIVAWFLVHDERQALLAALIGGIFGDLITFGRLGTSSLIYLSVMGILLLYTRLKPSHNVVLLLGCLAVVYVVAFWLELLLRSQAWTILPPLGRLLGDMVLTCIFVAIFYYGIGVKEKEPLKLRV